MPVETVDYTAIVGALFVDYADTATGLPLLVRSYVAQALPVVLIASMFMGILSRIRGE